SLQGRGVGVDAERGAAAAGLGRSRGPPARLREARPRGSLPPPPRADADRLPLRPPREHARATALRLDRNGARAHVPQPHLLRTGSDPAALPLHLLDEPAVSVGVLEGEERAV